MVNKHLTKMPINEMHGFLVICLGFEMNSFHRICGLCVECFIRRLAADSA
jgi:hypothetical protein